MREPCIFCTMKHLASARSLLEEYESDRSEYKRHFFYAIGELAQAQAESMALWPELAQQVRDYRRLMETVYPDVPPDFEDLFDSAIPVWDTVIEEERNEPQQESEGEGQ